MLQNPVTVWFVMGLVLIIMEFFVPGVILVFFGAAAWIVCLTTLIGLTGSSTAQFLVFAIASICLIAFLRRWVRDKFIGHVTDIQNLEVNLDEFSGKIVSVLEAIEPGGMEGAVEFKGARWRAVSEEALAKGETARILSHDGITLKVEKVRR